ncbi:MAG: hypothetical protein EOP87_20735, partial [Verrucomicrobiaceae bacterium]
MIRYLAAVYFMGLVLDGVASAQEADFAAALGTPGLVWSAPITGGKQATVVAAAEAQGGGLVVIPAGNVVQVPVAKERFVKVRFRKSNARVRVDDTDAVSRPFTATPEDAGTPWMTYTYVMPKPGMLKIGNYGGDIEVDTVTLIEPTATTLAAAVGLPEGLLSVGDTSAWAIAPVAESDQYGAKTSLTENTREAWMELPVTGPAEVRVDYRQVWPATLRVSSGGKVRWDSAEDDYYGKQMVLELPAGEHVVRLAAGIQKWSTTTIRPGELTIAGIGVIPLQSGKMLAAMDDEGEPWVSNGGWEMNRGPLRDDPDSLGAVGVGNVSSHRLRRTVTGPGTVTFWSYMEPVPAGSISLQWWNDLAEGSMRNSFDSEPGWQRTMLWIPPGEHAMGWEISGSAAQFSHMAIDGFGFQPALEMAIGEAAGLPQAEWRTDEASPWRGVVREDGRVVASPAGASGTVSPLSTKLTGPG